MSTTILLTVAIMAIGFTGMAVRLFFIKGAEVRKTCASQTPMLAEEGQPCSFCGSMPGETCKSEETKPD